MKELVVEEFTVDGTATPLEIGDRYSYFKDPATGKYYRPAEGFTLSGEDLDDRFIEVPTKLVDQ